MNILRFGIPSLDRLLRPAQGAPREPAIDSYGLDLTGERLPISISLGGPEGTGKSVLALHMASRYRADTATSSAKVIYVSTDLSSTKARQVWGNFDLVRPDKRLSPFVRWEDVLGPEPEPEAPREMARAHLDKAELFLNDRYQYRSEAPSGDVNLIWHRLANDSEPMSSWPQQPVRPEPRLVDYLLGNERGCIGFVDLVEESPGDAWGLVNRILHALNEREVSQMEPRWPHLLIIDAVEGLESLVGERDAYGERASRRARINQLLRLASNNCHVLFVIEEDDERAHLPEDYMTDVVLRLRTRRNGQYNRRTIEVVKCRGQNHVRGEHPFTIRTGKGSTTGAQQNWDDPRLPLQNPRSENAKLETGRLTERQLENFQSYVVVFPSLHYLSRETMARSANEPSGPAGLRPSPFNVGFGIPYLDNMLAPSETQDRVNFGLPCHRVTALIGDPDTHKSSLGYSFLTEEFQELCDALTVDSGTGPNRNFEDVVAALGWWKNAGLLEPADDLREPDRIAQLLPDFMDWCELEGTSPNCTLARFANALRHTGGGVLLTTKDVDVGRLADHIAPWLAPAEHTRRLFKILIAGRLVCRRLEIHDLPTPVLFHIISHAIDGARRMIIGWKKGYGDPLRVRVVLDDFSTWKEIYPDIKNEPLFLPALLFLLRRAKVSSLIISTHPGRPDTPITDPFDNEVRASVDHQLYTWRVPFYGENRIAIAALPPVSMDLTSIVRELKASGRSRPQVDPHFELYAGLEEGKPELIPLAIYLYAATDQFREYMDREDIMYREQFRPIAASRNGESGRILWPLNASQYYAIRELTHLPWDAKADHTIVDQVDGFWSLDAPTGSLASMHAYLMKDLGEYDDPFHLFRGKPLHLHPRDQHRQAPWRRQYYFQNSGYRSRIVDFRPADQMPDRVPLMWDFSFILLPAAPWTAARRANKTVDFLLTGVPVDELPAYFKGAARASVPTKRIVDRLRGIAGQSTENIQRRVSTDRHDAKKPSSHSIDDEPSASTIVGSKMEFIPWRLFLGACKVVADYAREERAVNPVCFDFASTSAETLVSLFLEIWFSELSLSYTQLPSSDGRVQEWDRWLERLSSPTYEPLKPERAKAYALPQLLGSDLARKFEQFQGEYAEAANQYCSSEGLSHSGTAALEVFENAPATFDVRKRLFWQAPLPALSIYKTWLLLLDVLDFASVLDSSTAFEMRQPKDASPHAVAVRHYYRTACALQSRGSDDTGSLPDPKVALGMPGLFSVRGDSFLASPHASRSRLLGSHAMDLLCSRRANLTRMQMGIGLPVRDVMEERACRLMRTALRVVTVDRSQRSSSVLGRQTYGLGEIIYSDLCDLGGDPNPTATILGRNLAEWRRRWLFRNGIPEYDRVSRVFQKWIIRLFRWTISYRNRLPTALESGLKAYDALSVYRLAAVSKCDSFIYIAELCDYLVSDLAAAERKR